MLFLSGILFFGSSALMAQYAGVRGQVVDRYSRRAIEGVRIVFEGTGTEVKSDSLGNFYLRPETPLDSVSCFLILEGYLKKEYPDLIIGQGLDLGIVYMEQEAGNDLDRNVIPLSESDLFEEDVFAGSSGFLHAGRDVFLNRAAFDFSPAFFRVRGLDNRNARVYLNGIPMNRFSDGRPQWNNWGGLNDVSRNQQYYMGLEAPDSGFGGVVGTTAMDISPETIRKGFRLTMSASNRNYTGRLMATYNSGMGKQGIGFMASVSKRSASAGYMDGTSYDAYSVLMGIAFRPLPKHEFNLVGIYASNLRGRSSALTAEAFALGGRKYNPYWGLQDGRVRNSRLRYIAEPLVNLRYRYSGTAFKYTLALAYRKGIQYRTRLAYFNAPNPDPVYYRNLPSFYLNNSFGPNLLSADAARKGFQNSAQMDWAGIYRVNQLADQGQAAAYILQADCTEEGQFSANTFVEWEVAKHLSLKAGVLFHKSGIANYGRLDDLLGASFHADIDPFSNTQNDAGGMPEKQKGDRIGYNYDIRVNQWQTFLTLKTSGDKWRAYLVGQFGNTGYRRTGLFQNEKYADSSVGPGTQKIFPEFGLKGGGTYQISGRHWLKLNGAFLRRSPVLRNAFINPRERHGFVKDLQSEAVYATDVSYFLRGTVITSRLTAYYTRIMDQAGVNFFFSDTGYGSAFVQEIATGLDALHKGLEFGMELELSPSVQLSAVLAFGDFKYASDPDLHLYFLPGQDPGDIRGAGGTLFLGEAALKGKNISSGPSRAFGLGIHYRGQGYWWVGTTLNYLSGQYPSPSFLRHTRSFLQDPETGLELQGAIREEYPRALQEQALPSVYLFNLIGGKSWKKGPHYVSLFLSVANLLDASYLSGGYQSGRNGNLKQWYEDQLSGNPSFGPRFWPGFGRTFFINLSWSFS